MRPFRRCKPGYTYSQCGEDVIAAYLLQSVLGIPRPTYLDIGAHDPCWLSNTYRFYRQGCRGVCVEPDPLLCRKIKRRRPRDVCLNVGICGASSAQGQSEADFYVMSPRTLNTFSKQEAESYARQPGYAIEKVIRLPLASVNDVIHDNFEGSPNFVSLDTEGWDVEIIRTFDFSHYRPEILSVETTSHVEQTKLEEVFDLMQRAGYLAYADTYVNTLFVEERRFLEATKLEAGLCRGVQPRKAPSMANCDR